MNTCSTCVHWYGNTDPTGDGKASCHKLLSAVTMIAFATEHPDDLDPQTAGEFGCVLHQAEG